MTLLFDENLSHRLIARLSDLFPGSQHVRGLGPGGTSDGVIWEVAATAGHVIVSKDTDFFQRAMLIGPRRR